MYPIVRKEKLQDNIVLMDIKAPRVAKECLPGQFIIAKTDEIGERIPLTICDYDREKETVTIVVQTIGAGTERMMALEEGDSLEDFVGPLGCPSELCLEENLEETKKKKIVFIAGGLGTAPVYPQVKWMHEHGFDCDVIIGARNKDLIIMEDMMRKVATNLYVCTDDGSYGFHGNGCQQLQALVDEGKTYDLCVSIGPMIMSLVGACGLRLIWIATVFQIPQFHRISTVYLSYPITWTITFLAQLCLYVHAQKKLKGKGVYANH